MHLRRYAVHKTFAPCTFIAAIYMHFPRCMCGMKEKQVQNGSNTSSNLVFNAVKIWYNKYGRYRVMCLLQYPMINEKSYADNNCFSIITQIYIALLASENCPPGHTYFKLIVKKKTNNHIQTHTLK